MFSVKYLLLHLIGDIILRMCATQRGKVTFKSKSKKARIIFICFKESVYFRLSSTSCLRITFRLWLKRDPC